MEGSVVLSSWTCCRAASVDVAVQLLNQQLASRPAIPAILAAPCDIPVRVDSSLLLSCWHLLRHWTLLWWAPSDIWTPPATKVVSLPCPARPFLVSVTSYHVPSWVLRCKDGWSQRTTATSPHLRGQAVMELWERLAMIQVQPGHKRQAHNELGACGQVGPGSPASGSYYKYSIERGESAIKWIYSGANCTGAQWWPKCLLKVGPS